MIEQGSEAWHQKRLGKVTASRIADVMAKTKSGWGASRANYLSELVAQRLTGIVQEGYTNAAMEWGKATETEARAAYSWHVNQDVELVDFVDHPAIGQSGASPDGLVGQSGLVEIKCPSTSTHIETLRGRSVPGKYVHQMQWQMACTGRTFCDFASFDPRMPDDMRLFVVRLNRDDDAIKALEAEVRVFLAEVDATVADLVRLYRTDKAA